MEHKWVVLTDLNPDGYRIVFSEGNRTMRHFLASKGLTLVSNSQRATMAFVPDGTHHLAVRSLPFTTFSQLESVLNAKPKTPEEPLTAAAVETPSNEWAMLVDHVWTELSGQPRSLDAAVWTELMQPTWAQFLDRVGTPKWQFHPYLYRPIRTWLLRIREKLHMALEVWISATDPPAITAETAVKLQERLAELWHDKTKVDQVYPILTELRVRVHTAITETLPLMLRIYQDAIIEEAPVPTMYNGIRKPLFLYAQELVVCLYDQNPPVLTKIKELATRLSLEFYDRKDVLEKIEQLHKEARKIMQMEESQGVLWIELESFMPGVDLSCFSYFTETADEETRQAWITKLQEIGRTVRSDAFQQKMRKRFWPLLFID